MLSKQQIDTFKQDGLLIIPAFYDYQTEIEPIHRGIYRIIGILLEKYGVSARQVSYSAETFDSGYQQLIQANRSYGAEVYDAVKQIPAFIRLVANEKNEQVFKSLFDTELPGIAAAGYGVRIDNPNEELFRAQWHQEYLSQLRSLSGAVFWSPLVKISPEIGPVEFCPGSHREGVRSVTSHDPDNPGKTGAYALRLSDEDKVISQYSRIAPLTSPGDLVIIDWLLLHRSGFNKSDRSRWSLQMRYFDYLEENGISISWCGSFSAGKDVRKIHPEYFTD